MLIHWFSTCSQNFPSKLQKIVLFQLIYLYDWVVDNMDVSTHFVHHVHYQFLSKSQHKYNNQSLRHTEKSISVSIVNYKLGRYSQYNHNKCVIIQSTIFFCPQTKRAMTQHEGFSVNLVALLDSLYIRVAYRPPSIHIKKKKNRNVSPVT